MAVGVTVCCATAYYKYNAIPCDVEDSNLFWGYVAIASSRFVLFFSCCRRGSASSSALAWLVVVSLVLSLYTWPFSAVWPKYCVC